MTVKASQSLKVKEVIARLKRAYPAAKCSLNYKTPFELLIATMLSAQCTDERVNKVTPDLFKQFPSPEAFLRANIIDIEVAIHSTGFYKNKAKSIKSCAKDIVENHEGAVPRILDELVKLRGVGRRRRRR